ncbi:reverse gyrase [Acidianus ambivalens]|uniref:Reverse gyrase n=1 Tax=Acidianus ambivalens TaxID=2283 RepID=A0A650CXH9_ACIAM|nr:reverse gyrase [Acidianus ambivalens]MQL54699.1 reverse gyrase [Acidianus ambivalens]QGR22498.1 reverse gyrase [Acidianus ambivalens]
MSEDLPNLVYMNSCPNCGGEITANRLYKGSACEKCIKEDIQFNSVYDLALYLLKNKNLINLRSPYEILKELKEVERLFKRVLGSPPLGPQRSWIVRALRGESFAIIAPPGLGKTTFGILMSLYFAEKQRKTLMIFPTKTLVNQVVQRIQEMSKSLEEVPKLVYYYSGITQSQKSELNKILESGDFDIFVSTSRYIINNVDYISTKDYKYLFVDDVDSVLKSSKSARAVLKLVGFTEDDIQNVRELLRKSKNSEEVYDEIRKIREKKSGDKIAIFSSATITKGNPVFSALMGFRPGSAVIYLRNVIDSYVQLSSATDEEIIDIVNKIVNKLGSGGLIFVPIDKGVSFANEIASSISGLKAEAISSTSITKLDKFEKGEIDVLVGVATHYGILVRGIDIPWRIRYAVFAGIPRFRFKIGETMHPLAMLKMLTLISLVSKDEEVTKILRIVRNKLRRISPAALVMLANSVKSGKIEDKYIQEAYDLTNKYLRNEEILEKIAEIGEISINNGYISTPDYLTYIQASGRTSRIFGGELTTGLSVLLVDNPRLFELLNRRLSIVLDEVNWNLFDIDNNKIGNNNLHEILKRIDSEREKIRKIKKEGLLTSASVKNIKTVLFIVESPNKAKTISNFFSKPSIRVFNGAIIYETVIGDKVLMVTASGGHVYDLTTKNIGIHGIEVRKNSNLEFIPYYNTIKRCNNGHQFTEYAEGNKCPTCGSTIIKDKIDVINSFRQLALEADEILIGTDPDVEGEKISWDLYLALRPYNPNIKRAEFHEVTRRAIVEAINNSRQFSIPLLQSQVVRRVEDRWIGFSLSSKLQTVFWPQYCSEVLKRTDCGENKNLSAGRVQTPVLGWVINRYNKYNETKRTVFIVKFLNSLSVLVPKQADLDKNDVKVVVYNISKSSETFGPMPPYTTDEMLSDASNLYGISAPEAMRVAQDLFEMGLITYHRTDSTRISNTGIAVAENYLKEVLEDKYKEIFKPRTWGEGGAHEAIRPTRPLDESQLRALIEEGELELPKRLTLNHYRIYGLIFSRFISSQIVPLNVYKLKFNVKVLSNGKELKVENPEMELIINVSLPGGIDVNKLSLYYPRSYFASRDSSYADTIKKLEDCSKSGQCEFVGSISSSFVKSDYQLYTQGELITEMKNKKIGRPSTYATIIATLLKRGYMLESKKVKRLVPSKLGINVYNFLTSKYSKFVSEERTRQLLELMDLIEDGKEDYRQVLKQLYDEIQSIG